jgi:hypothetical protein
MTTFLKLCVLFALVALAFAVFGQNPLGRVAMPVPKTNWLVWNPGTAKEWKVSTGPARGLWTNVFYVTTNRVLMVAGTHYRVEAFDVETSLLSVPALWPSNRVARMVIEATDAATGVKSETVWQIYTNAPDGGGKILRLREELVRLE